MSEAVEMTFLEHLEELRWHLLRSIIAIFAISIIIFLFPNILFDQVIFAPKRPDFISFRLLCDFGNLYGSEVLCIKDIPVSIISRSLPQEFTYHIMSSLIAGFIVSFPYVFWEIWRFVGPGLHDVEQKSSRGAVFFVSLLFGLGISFGYFMILPLSINFLSHYSISDEIVKMIDLSSYVSFVLTLVLMCGLVFQLPMVVFFLSKVGVVTPRLMKEYRKHSFIVILVLGALITPPDIFSQLFIALPLYLLYEVSIYISATVLRKEIAKQEALELEKKEHQDLLANQAEAAAKNSKGLDSISREP